MHFVGYLLSYLLNPWSTVLLEKLTGYAASQEIPRILWNSKVHDCLHKCPPLVSIHPTYIPVLNICPYIICLFQQETQHSFLYCFPFFSYVRNFDRYLQDNAFDKYRVLTHSNHLPYCDPIFYIKDSWLRNLLGALPLMKMNVILFHVNVIYKKQNKF